MKLCVYMCTGTGTRSSILTAVLYAWIRTCSLRNGVSVYIYYNLHDVTSQSAKMMWSPPCCDIIAISPYPI